MPDENKIFERINYEHPLYDTNAIIGQQNLESIQGYRDIWYSGAWTDNGFHEAGISSSVKIISKLNGVLPWNWNHKFLKEKSYIKDIIKKNINSNIMSLAFW